MRGSRPLGAVLVWPPLPGEGTEDFGRQSGVREIYKACILSPKLLTGNCCGLGAEIKNRIWTCEEHNYTAQEDQCVPTKFLELADLRASAEQPMGCFLDGNPDYIHILPVWPQGSPCPPPSSLLLVHCSPDKSSP